MFKKFKILLVALVSFFLVVSCTNVPINDMDKMKFVSFPQSTYLMVDPSDAAKVLQAYYALLEEISIEITSGDTEPVIWTLKEAVANNEVTINFDESILTSPGTKSIVITMGENKRIKLNYVISVVKGEENLFAGGKGIEQDPFLIATPQQFMNISTRFFGVPVPTEDASEDLWMYYYQFSFPYLAGGKHYKLVNDLDFTGVDYKTLGSLGGMNYIPFTGVLDGNNKKIMNLTVNTFSDSSSLFAALSGATVKNLTFTNINIESRGKYGAALFSQPGRNGEAYINIVDNVNVESGLIIAERVGGLAGEADDTFFKNCTIGLEANPGSLVLREYLGSNSGGIAGAALERKYSYKTLNYSGSETHVNLFGFAEIKDLSGIKIDENDTINGIKIKQNVYRTDEQIYDTINAEEPKKYNVVIYNCNVYSLIYLVSTQRGGVYMDGTSHNVFIFNEDNDIKNIVLNNNTDVIKEVLVNSKMNDDEYAYVNYSLSGKFDGGSYSWQVVYSTEDVFAKTEFNLNILNFENKVYDMDGVLVNTLKPKFINGEKYKLAAFYYDAEGNILGVYIETIAENTYTLDSTNRILTKNN